MANRLTNIKTMEVSLVGKAANERRFLLFKSADGKPEEQPGEKTEKQLTENQAGQAVGEDQLRETLKVLPDGVRGQLEALWKAQNTKTEEALQKAVALEVELRKERDALREKEFIEKARSLSDLPVNPEEFAGLLKSLSDKAPEEYGKLEGLLQAVNQQIAKSSLYGELGSNRSQSQSGSAWGRIEEAAKSAQEKDAKLSKADAVARVLKEHPDLYDEYLAEQRQR